MKFEGPHTICPPSALYNVASLGMFKIHKTCNSFLLIFFDTWFVTQILLDSWKWTSSMVIDISTDVRTAVHHSHVQPYVSYGSVPHSMFYVYLCLGTWSICLKEFCMRKVIKSIMDAASHRIATTLSLQLQHVDDTWLYAIMSAERDFACKARPPAASGWFFDNFNKLPLLAVRWCLCPPCF